HKFPSTPEAIPRGQPKPASGNSLRIPLVSMRPTLPPKYSVNQSAPSGPLVMCKGPLSGVGIGKSATAPLGVILPTLLLGESSVNQRLPSGPEVIKLGEEPLLSA